MTSQTFSNQPEAGVSLSATQLLERFASGEKRFRQVQLKKINLQKANLAQIDLREADLSYANLREADLSGADLRDACLEGADLYKANLSRANLQGARLAKTNFKEANLQRVSLEGAFLEGAFLTKAMLGRANLKDALLMGAHLNEADLSYANLSNAFLDGAYLLESNLSKATLTEASLIDALLSGATLSGANFNDGFYSDKTNFDAGFDPVSVGLRKAKKITLEDLLSTFKHLSDCSSRYFGNKMAAKYWESSRPNIEWLQQFQISASGQITYSGTLSEPLTFYKLRSCQKWIERYIKSCSMIIQEFPTLIDPNKIEFYQ